MNWYDLNYYEIHRIADEQKRKEYIGKYYLYMTKISGPIIEELRRRGFNFEYSGSVNKMTIKEMAAQLQQFYTSQGIAKETMREAVMETLKKKK